MVVIVVVVEVMVVIVVVVIVVVVIVVVGIVVVGDCYSSREGASESAGGRGCDGDNRNCSGCEDCGFDGGKVVMVVGVMVVGVMVVGVMVVGVMVVAMIRHVTFVVAMNY